MVFGKLSNTFIHIVLTSGCSISYCSLVEFSSVVAFAVFGSCIGGLLDPCLLILVPEVVRIGVGSWLFSFAGEELVELLVPESRVILFRFAVLLSSRRLVVAAFHFYLRIDLIIIICV